MLIVFLLQGNPIFLHLKSLKKNLFVTVWVMFWNISRIYFFFFSIQNIKSNCYIIFLKFFPIIFFWWKIYSFPVTFIYDLIFVILFGSFLISSWFNAAVTAYWKHLLSFLLMGFIVAFLLFIHSGESIDYPPRLRFIL